MAEQVNDGGHERAEKLDYERLVACAMEAALKMAGAADFAASLEAGELREGIVRDHDGATSMRLSSSGDVELWLTIKNRETIARRGSSPLEEYAHTTLELRRFGEGNFSTNIDPSSTFKVVTQLGARREGEKRTQTPQSLTISSLKTTIVIDRFQGNHFSPTSGHITVTGIEKPTDEAFGTVGIEGLVGKVEKLGEMCDQVEMRHEAQREAEKTAVEQRRLEEVRESVSELINL